MIELLAAAALVLPTAGQGLPAAAPGHPPAARGHPAVAPRRPSAAAARAALPDSGDSRTAGASVPDSMLYRGSAGELRVAPPRHDGARVEVDGYLREPQWRRAAVLTGFTQYEPSEGIPAVEGTEVRVFYTADAMYFGIRARDSRPGKVRSSVAERDRSIFEDDWVRLTLDTFAKQRQAYVLYVNPRGIQTDGLWIEGLQRRRGGPRIPVDFNPDFIWQSDGRVTDGGWVAEVRVPYVSLRFPEERTQEWGVNVAREVRRLGYKQSWAPISRSESNTLAQSGRLTGLTGLEPRRLREVTPVLTGKWNGERRDGEFVRGDPEPAFGANARYGLSQNLTLGATFNPDFSQVEADAPQVAVNERFALFFPEKRPFFLEGTEVFTSPNRLVHTRQVVDPVGGAKVTGRLGSVDVGYLGAVDEAPVSFGDAEHRAAYNFLRLKKDVGASSNVGALYTDRSSLGGGKYNRVAAVDVRLLFGGRYTFTGQVAGAWTADRGGDDPGFGQLASARLERSGREFSWRVELEDVHPDFRAESGLIRRVGDARLAARAERNFFTEPGTFLERVGVEVRTNSFFSHAALWDLNAPFEYEFELQPSVSFRGGHWLGVIFRDGFFRFRRDRYREYRVLGPDGELDPFRVPEGLDHMLATGGFGNLRLSEAVSLRGRVFLRQTPIFSETSLGKELLVSPSLELQPTDQLSVSAEYTLSRIWREEDGSLFSRVDLPRLRTQFMFSRSLLARVILQYDLQEREALRDPRSGRPLFVGGERAGPESEGDFQAQLLLSYEPSPGTVFFIGYSRHEAGERTFRLSELDPTRDGFFVKASYLTRF